MSDVPRDLGEAEPQDSQAQKSFMKDFEKAIVSYAQAVEAGKGEEALVRCSPNRWS